MPSNKRLKHFTFIFTGAPKLRSIKEGLPPIAYISLTFTETSLNPSWKGVVHLRSKCTFSTIMSVVMRSSEFSGLITAESSPIPRIRFFDLLSNLFLINSRRESSPASEIFI